MFSIATVVCGLSFCLSVCGVESLAVESGKVVKEGKINVIDEKENEFLAGVKTSPDNYLGYDDQYYYREARIEGSAGAPNIEVARCKRSDVSRSALEERLIKKTKQNAIQPPVYDKLLKWMEGMILKSGIPREPENK